MRRFLPTLSHRGKSLRAQRSVLAAAPCRRRPQRGVPDKTVGWVDPGLEPGATQHFMARRGCWVSAPSGCDPRVGLDPTYAVSSVAECNGLSQHQHDAGNAMLREQVCHTPPDFAVNDIRRAWIAPRLGDRHLVDRPQ